jgi:hypothetical protein
MMNFRSILIFFLSPLTGGCLLISCTSQKAKLELPLVVDYEVQCADTGALALVNTYFAEQFSYTMHDSTHFSSQRKALIGNFHMWYDGEQLYVREFDENFCVCTLVEGELLELWEGDEVDSTYYYSEDKRDEILGFKTYKGVSKSESEDRTDVLITDEIPNLWFDIRSFPGLPLKYWYTLRDAEVAYVAAAVRTDKAVTFDPSGYDRDCVRMPAQAYLGLEPKSDLFPYQTHVWVFGELVDEMENPIAGLVTVESDVNGLKSKAAMRCDQGTFDIELRLGGVYVLDFTAPDHVHKRIQIDTRNIEASEGGFLSALTINLFQPENAQVEQYMASKVLGIAAFEAEQGNLAFDSEYTEAVMREVTRLRELGE